MAALIPAEVVNELMQQQHQANDPTQASPAALAGIFHPAMQLQLAQALRQRQMGVPQARAPLADHVRQAKMAGTANPAQPQPGAGTMSIQSHPNLGTNAPMPLSPQAQDELAWYKTIIGKETGQMPQVTMNPGGTSATELNAMSAHAVNAGMRRNAQHLMPGESIQPIAGGYQINGAAPQQAANPADQMLGSFKGHVPDHLIAAAQSALAGGMPISQVFSHLQTAAQQAEKPAKDNSAAETRTMVQAKVRHLEEQKKIVAEHGEDTGAIDKQIDTLINQLGPQQTAPQVPQPPKAGHPIDIQSAQHFMQLAGGNPAKARELAKQAGWSF